MCRMALVIQMEPVKVTHVDITGLECPRLTVWQNGNGCSAEIIGIIPGRHLFLLIFFFVTCSGVRCLFKKN